MSKVLDRFAIIIYQGTLYPVKIIETELPNFLVSIMEKTQEGWTFPSEPRLSSVDHKGIIKLIDNNNIQKVNDHYIIDDDFLVLEWG